MNWSNFENLVNIMKDKDIITFILLGLSGIEWYLGYPKYTIMSGIAALLYRLIFKTTEDIRKSKKYYKQWRSQILSRMNEKGHEIGINREGFLKYFPNGTEEQFKIVIEMIKSDKTIPLKYGPRGIYGDPYYLGN